MMHCTKGFAFPHEQCATNRNDKTAIHDEIIKSYKKLFNAAPNDLTSYDITY